MGVISVDEIGEIDEFARPGDRSEDTMARWFEARGLSQPQERARLSEAMFDLASDLGRAVDRPRELLDSQLWQSEDEHEEMEEAKAHLVDVQARMAALFAETEALLAAGGAAT